MRYLIALALLLSGCATQLAVSTPSHEYSIAEVQRMLRSGAAVMARDTATNGWLVRDTAGVVLMSGLAAPVESPGLPAGYGDCLAK